MIVSLRTRSRDKACLSSKALSERLERYWESLHLEFLNSRELGLQIRSDIEIDSTISYFTIDDALELYLYLKGLGRRKTFFELANRTISYFKEATSTIKITSLSPSDASAFREYLFSQGLSSSSVRRIFSCNKSILNLAIKEKGLSCRNVFAATYIPDYLSSQRRLPIPQSNIIILQNDCFILDDDNRWLIAFISDTGMRLSEAAGLHVDDINVRDEIPFINLIANPWRSLKTKSSERNIPLVGAIFWAAKRIIAHQTNYAFSKYILHKQPNSNSASAAINKWLKPRVPDGCVVYSFTHSLRVRLRSVERPSDIVDALGG